MKTVTGDVPGAASIVWAAGDGSGGFWFVYLVGSNGFIRLMESVMSHWAGGKQVVGRVCNCGG